MAGTKCTLFLLIPAPKTRLSFKGMVYSSSSEKDAAILAYLVPKNLDPNSVEQKIPGPKDMMKKRCNKGLEQSIALSASAQNERSCSLF